MTPIVSRTVRNVLAVPNALTLKSVAREFALLDIRGASGQPGRSNLSAILSAGARIRQLASRFFSISGAAFDPTGKLYFVDAHQQRIHRWAQQDSEVVVVRDYPLDPINLAFDPSGDLLAVSYQGNRNVNAFRPGSPETQMTPLKPELAQLRPGMSVSGPLRICPSRHRGNMFFRTETYSSRQAKLSSSANCAGERSCLLSCTPSVLRARLPGAPSISPTSQIRGLTQSLSSPMGPSVRRRSFAEDEADTVAQDKNGNVYLAAEQVLGYSGDGKLLGRIDIPDIPDIPDRPIDLVFGRADRRTVYILTHSSPYAVQTTIPGL